MRILIPLILALSFSGAAAYAAEPPTAPAELKRAFGNTIVSTYPDGRTAVLWLQADGSYEAKGRRRTPSGGTWSVKGEKVCLKQLKPIKGPFKYCTGLPRGETWSAKAVTGEPIKVKLLTGHTEKP